MSNYYITCTRCGVALTMTGGIDYLNLEDIDGELEDFLFEHSFKTGCSLVFNEVLPNA